MSPLPRAIVWTVLTILAAGGSTRALTLDECIGIALEKSPDLQASFERVRMAEAEATRTRSIYYPMVSAMGRYERTDNPPNAFFMNLNQRTASTTGRP